jgi:hypothetical protein
LIFWVLEAANLDDALAWARKAARRLSGAGRGALHIGTISMRWWLTHDQEVRILLPAVKDLMRLPR